MALSLRGPRFRGAVRTTFVVPAYNEAPTIEEVLRRLDGLGLDKQVIVVDDGSTDATPAILARWAARRPDILVLRKPNGGKGSALRAAIPWIQGDVVVIQDADLEYDPVDVPALIEPIARGRADVVYGSRLVGGRPQRVHLFWHRVGNRALSLLTDILFNTTLSDMESGYKAFRADVLTSLTLTEDGFGIEPEITAAVCRGGLRIYELPVSYYGRSYAEGKKITWRDGLTAVRVLLRARGAHAAGTSSHTLRRSWPNPRSWNSRTTYVAPCSDTVPPAGSETPAAASSDVSTCPWRPRMTTCAPVSRCTSLR